MRGEKKYKAVFSGEPDIAIGEEISFAVATMGNSDAESVAKFVNNWEVLKGAILAVVYVDPLPVVIGTAFFAAPGVAISATHVFSDAFDDLSLGRAKVFCVGIGDSEAQVWRIEKINWSTSHDISVLSLSPISSMPGNRTYFQFPLTTRTPKNGENVNIIGFRNEPCGQNVAATISLNMMASAGHVTAVYPEKRDNILVCYPAIEIQAGSLGGMSGGVAVDDSGHVIGVISRGFDSTDGKGPTYASWIINALNLTCEITWPRHFYKEPTAILAIDPRLVALEGREAIERWDDNSIHFRIWFDKGVT